MHHGIGYIVGQMDRGPPTAATSGGGHSSTYCFQAGGTHPTGMFSYIDLTFLASENKVNI